MIAREQYERPELADWYNVGPDDCDCLTTGELVEKFCRAWGDAGWVSQSDDGPHEANFLKLDCSKLKAAFGWKPRWNLDTAMEMVVQWSKCWADCGDIRGCMDEQIGQFLKA